MASTIEKNFEYFLKSKFEEFEEGEWVAIYNDKIIFHDKNLKTVIEKAKAIAPAYKILFSKIKKTASYL